MQEQIFRFPLLQAFEQVSQFMANRPPFGLAVDGPFLHTRNVNLIRDHLLGLVALEIGIRDLTARVRIESQLKVKHHHSTLVIRSFLCLNCFSDEQQFVWREGSFCWVTKTNVVSFRIARSLDGLQLAQRLMLKISIAPCDSPFIEGTECEEIIAFLCGMLDGPLQVCTGSPFVEIRPVKTLRW